MTQLKLKIHIITEEFFQFALVTYLILFLAETIKTGFISYFFNLNILIITVFIVGILMVMTQEPEASKQFKHSDVSSIKGSLYSRLHSASLREYAYSNQKNTTYINNFHPNTQLLITATSTFPNQEVSHAEKACTRAQEALHNAQEIARKVSLQYTNTHLHSEYTAKIVPYERLIQNTLQILSGYIETDSQYNTIAEEILKNSEILTSQPVTGNKQTIHKDLLYLQDKKSQTIRGKNEKLLEIYIQSLVLQLKQIENKK